MSIDILSHQFNISEISTTGIPIATPTFNELDSHGSFLGLPRLPSELNSDYRKRLVDVYVHRANSTYRGLVNGITRELGLDFFKPIKITLAPGVSSSIFPRIDFIDNIVYIWSDFYTAELEMTLQRGRREYPEFYIGGLVDQINTSSVFRAELLDSDYEWKLSDNIINVSSSTIVSAQNLVSGTINYLGNSNIERGTVVFSDLATFRMEVSSANLVNSVGKYYIDYLNGVVKSFSVPRDASRIRYRYRPDELIPEASPVIVRAVGSPEFQQLMFNQILQPDGTYTSGIPTKLGKTIVCELQSVSGQVWGT